MILRRLDHALGMVENVFVSVGLGAFFLIVPFITVDVFMRYFLNRPIMGSLEINELSMALLLFFCLGYATRLKSHFSVEIIASRFPDNVKVNLERLGYILGIVVFFLIVWQGTKMGIKYWHRNETTGILNLPKYIFRLMLPVGGTLGCLELILLLIRSFVAEDSLPDNAGKGK